MKDGWQQDHSPFLLWAASLAAGIRNLTLQPHIPQRPPSLNTSTICVSGALWTGSPISSVCLFHLFSSLPPPPGPPDTSSVRGCALSHTTLLQACSCTEYTQLAAPQPTFRPSFAVTPAWREHTRVDTQSRLGLRCAFAAWPQTASRYKVYASNTTRRKRRQVTAAASFVPPGHLFS